MPLSPPLPISPPLLPASPTYPLGFRAAMIQKMAESPSTSHSLPLPPPIILSYTRAPMAVMMAAAPSTYTLAPPSGTPPLLPIPLPIPSPPLLLPSTKRRAERPEVCLPPRKRLCNAQGPKYKVGDSSSTPRPTEGFRTDYGFVATLDAEIRRDPERDVGYGITDTWDEMLDTDEIYRRLDEAQDARTVLSGQLNLLQRDKRSYVYTSLLMEREARLSCEAWGRFMATSKAARSKVMALCTTVLGHQEEIAALRAADRARQAQLVETLRMVSTLQTKVIALQGQQGPAGGPALQGQQGPAGGPAQPEVPEEAGGIIFSYDLKKMASKRATRSTSVTTTTTTSVTNAQLNALIDQGIADALAARDADKSINGKDSHD
ncbi:hypothetical protein Tco_0943414 [Tanacetum coccineum]